MLRSDFFDLKIAANKIEEGACEGQLWQTAYARGDGFTDDRASQWMLHGFKVSALGRVDEEFQKVAYPELVYMVRQQGK